MLELKDLQNIQLSFFRNLCHLRKSVTPHIIFREFAERPWLDSWWSMVLGFMRRLSLLPAGSLHLDILQEHVPIPGAHLCARQRLDSRILLGKHTYAPLHNTPHLTAYHTPTQRNTPQHDSAHHTTEHTPHTTQHTQPTQHTDARAASRMARAWLVHVGMRVGK